MSLGYNDRSSTGIHRDDTCGILSYICERQGEEMPTGDFERLPLAINGDCIHYKPISDDIDVKNVIFNPPVTVVLWTDGTKTISRCSEDDSYEERTGFLVCVAKKLFGNGTRYRKVMKKFDIPDYGLVDIIRHQLDPNVHTTFIEEE